MKYKFRAWYPILSIMFYDIRVGGFDGDTVPTHFDTTRNDHCWLPIWGDNKDGFVMQYIGLNDKKRVEICGGDIVKQHDDIGIVKTCPGGYECEMIGGDCKGSTFNMTWISEDCCEVIGNIYENPELLKESQNDR